MRFCSDNMRNSALNLNKKGINPQLAMDLTQSAYWLAGLLKSTQKPDFQLTPTHAVYLRKAAWLRRDYESAMGKDNIVCDLSPRIIRGHPPIRPLTRTDKTRRPRAPLKSQK